MPDSRAQYRMAQATIGGAKTGMPKDVAQEIVNRMHGKKLSSLPERAKGSDSPVKRLAKKKE